MKKKKKKRELGMTWRILPFHIGFSFSNTRLNFSPQIKMISGDEFSPKLRLRVHLSKYDGKFQGNPAFCIWSRMFNLA